MSLHDLTQEDAARVVAREATGLEPDRLPAAVREATKRRILDTIGVVVAGGGLGQGSGELAALVVAEGGVPESRLLGTGRRVPCRSAAMANGGFSHALDYDDVYSPVRVHPDAISVPAALAVAEMVGGVSGSALIAAVALADEISIRIGKAIFQAPQQDGEWPGRMWHPTLVCGYFGATLAAARILELDERRMLDAFGITLYRTAGTLAYVKGARNLVAELYYGFPCEVGVTSALLAARGVTGPADVLEGEGGLFPAFFGESYDRGALVDDFGAEFEAGIELKPWPAVRTSHGYIEAALALIETGLRPEEVTDVRIRCGELARLACEPLAVRIRPSTAIDAKFSIPFIVSVALAKGAVRIADFLPDNLADPQVLALADRVRVVPDSSLDGDGGFRGAGFVAAAVEVSTRDGRTLQKRVEFGRGGPGAPLGDAELAAKFRDCCAYSAQPIRPDHVDRLIEMVLRLETVTDVGEMMAFL